MSRIIAGELGGRRLEVPKSGTRPTTDRVREALFSTLGNDGALQGAKVLDVFAGSGALGFEALSRGAAHATFIEAARPAATVIKRNAASLGVDSKVSILTAKAPAALPKAGSGFTLAFLDPPYDIAPHVLAETLAALPAILAPHSVVVVETSTRTPDPVWPAVLHGYGTRDYGETRLHFAERIG